MPFVQEGRFLGYDSTLDWIGLITILELFSSFIRYRIFLKFNGKI